MSEKTAFDTDVLIWYFRGLEAAAQVIADIPFEQRFISSLCIMELTQVCISNRELKDTSTFVKDAFCKVIHCDKAMSEKAITLLSTRFHTASELSIPS